MPDESGRLLGVFRRLAARTASTSNLEQLLQFIIAELLELLDAESGSIMVHEPSENRLLLYFSASHPGEISGKRPRQGTSLPADQGIAGRVMAEGRPILFTQVERADDRLGLRRKQEGGSFLSFPLKIHRKMIGVLNLNRSRSREGFSAQDLSRLKLLAPHLAALVDKGRLLARLRMKNDEVESLYALTTILFRESDFQKALKSFLDGLVKRLKGCRAAIIRLTDAPPGPPRTGPENPKFSVLSTSGMVQEDLNKGIRSIIRKLRTDLSEEWAPDWDDPQLQPPVTLPFMMGRRRMEMYCLPISTTRSTSHFLLVSADQKFEDRESALQRYRFLYLVSRQVGAALERAEMVAQIQDDRELLMFSATQDRAFLEISQELASTLDPNNVLTKTFKVFEKVVGYTTIAIAFYEEVFGAYRFVIQPSQPVSSAYLQKVERLVKEHLQEFLLETPGFPLSTLRPEIQSPPMSSEPAVGRIVNEFALPIVMEGKVCGLIHLTRHRGPAFDNRDNDSAYLFTSLFLNSIKNAIIHKRTERLAYTDPLTGLANHRFFQETLFQEFVRARRYHKALSLMILDIDHFKKFNDTFGHLVGDKVLGHVGRIFDRSIRERIDTVARYGGEEFAVLLPETGLAGAGRFGDRVREAIEREPLNHEGRDLPITISVGVACTAVTSCQNQSELIRAADLALYEAKEGGRNQVKIYDKGRVENGQ